MTVEAVPITEVSLWKGVLSMLVPTFGTCLTETMHRLG